MSQRMQCASRLTRGIKVPWSIAIPAALLAGNGDKYLEISQEVPNVFTRAIKRVSAVSVKCLMTDVSATH